MSHDHAPPFSSPLPLQIVGAMVLATFIAVLMWERPPPRTAPDDGVIGFRSLTFTDGDNGEVLVRDGYTGEAVETLGQGHGFLRATLRTLAKERLAAGHPREAPFHLREYESGQLLLIDPTTGQIIDLWAFGAPNRAAFAKYVQPGGPPKVASET